MDIEEYLKDELKRLNRRNDLLEKSINSNTIIENEPEQIVKNVLAMCELANSLRKWY